MSISARERKLCLPLTLEARRNRQVQRKYYALRAELRSALAREESSEIEKGVLLKRQLMLQEFEHRLINGLQLITSLLSKQSRSAMTAPEAAAQLATAARRVASLGCVHRTLHRLDCEDNVEINEHLERLCRELSGLLLEGQDSSSIIYRGVKANLPATLAIPLGFIANELITNSTKHAGGNITVRFEAVDSGHLLAVEDDGPGLPAEFDPANSKGLGMKIVLSLVKEIGGELRILTRPNGQGACFSVAFG